MNRIVLCVPSASIDGPANPRDGAAILVAPQEGPTQRRGDPGTAGAPQPAAGTQEPGTAPPTGAQPTCMDSLSGQLPFFLAIGLIFYFLLIRPQQKQEKKRRELMAALKKGDQVVTNAGLHGEVVAVESHTVTLKVDRDVKLTFDRSAIHRLVNEPAAGTQAGAPAKPAGGA